MLGDTNELKITSFFTPGGENMPGKDDMLNATKQTTGNTEEFTYCRHRMFISGRL